MKNLSTFSEAAVRVLRVDVHQRFAKGTGFDGSENPKANHRLDVQKNVIFNNGIITTTTSTGEFNGDL